MKYKFLTLSLLLAGACATTVMAQDTNYYTPKWSDNIFVSVGGGIHAIENDGFNKLAPHFSISLGKLITPTWGIVYSPPSTVAVTVTTDSIIVVTGLNVTVV